MCIIHKQIHIIAHYLCILLMGYIVQKMRPNELEKYIDSNFEIVCNKYYFTKFSIQSYFVCWRFESFILWLKKKKQANPCPALSFEGTSVLFQ